MVKSVECAYIIEGKGPPLFMVHGIGARKTSWAGLTQHLKDDFTCIAYDLRGHGESPKGMDTSDSMNLSQIWKRYVQKSELSARM